MEPAAVMTHDLVCRESERDAVVAACQQGDREAFQLLFERYKDRVYAIALHYSGNETTAHDIAQQVFLKLMTCIGQFNWQSEFSTWLYRLVANACYDEQRRWRRLIPFGEANEVRTMRTQENIEANYTRVEMADNIRAAIADLKPKLRLPILLKYIEGMSYEEMAQVLDCSMGTVASRLNRGHKALAQKLGHLRALVRENEDV
jgi:RNA polymerase sigma-70 factor, ECF subfamily